MASIAFQCVCRQARQLSRRSGILSPQSQASPLTSPRAGGQRRAFIQTPYRLATDGSDGRDSRETTNETAEDDTPEPRDTTTPHFDKKTYDELTISDQELYTSQDTTGRKVMETIHQALEEESAPDSPMSKELDREIRNAISELQAEGVELEALDPPSRTKKRQSIFNGRRETEDLGPDPEFREDDISSTAHGELEAVREIREMARTAAWEMPLLAELATPFSGRGRDRSTHPLKFRYTTYLGDHHAAARKVILSFAVKDLGLTYRQTEKLIKLCGSRFDPLTRTVRMSCESLETQAQNKRVLVQTVGRLIDEVKAKGVDKFQKVPFDFRYAKRKIQSKIEDRGFPVEWRMTAERRRERDAIRQSETEGLGQIGERSVGEETVQAGQRRESAATTTVAEAVAQNPFQEAQTVPARPVGKGRPRATI